MTAQKGIHTLLMEKIDFFFVQRVQTRQKFAFPVENTGYDRHLKEQEG